MRLTRRDFIMLLIGASIGALVDSGLSYYLSKLEKPSAVTKTIYGGNNPSANATETVTITVTKPQSTLKLPKHIQQLQQLQKQQHKRLQKL